MLLVGVGEEEVAEEGRVEEGLEDGVDVAGVADVVQAGEVRRDLVEVQGVCVFEMHF
jgi:hypothetical protein